MHGCIHTLSIKRFLPAAGTSVSTVNSRRLVAAFNNSASGNSNGWSSIVRCVKERPRFLVVLVVVLSTFARVHQTRGWEGKSTSSMAKTARLPYRFQGRWVNSSQGSHSRRLSGDAADDHGYCWRPHHRGGSIKKPHYMVLEYLPFRSLAQVFERAHRHWHWSFFGDALPASG